MLCSVTTGDERFDILESIASRSWSRVIEMGECRGGSHAMKALWKDPKRINVVGI